MLLTKIHRYYYLLNWSSCLSERRLQNTPWVLNPWMQQ